MAAGVDIRVMQRILRRPTITLTVDRYGKLRGLLGAKAQRTAVTTLPELTHPSRQQLAATGTDDASVNSVSCEQDETNKNARKTISFRGEKRRGGDTVRTFPRWRG